MTSMWQKWSQDATHAFQDFYGSLVLGDDAGQSANLVLVVNGTSAFSSSLPLDERSTPISSHPSTPGFRSSSMNHSKKKNNPTLASLGITFCEINERAYVQSVDPKSVAAEAGVLPRDSVQYAAVLAQEWKDPLGEDLEEIRKHALEREEAGQRISYKELKALLQSGVLMEPSAGGGSGATLRPLAVPTTIRVGGNPSNHHPRDTSTNKEKTETNNGSGITNARPMVLVFRRTKQRPSTVLPIWPHYRLDDECDVAVQILQSLATTPNDSASANDASLSLSSGPSTSSRRHQRGDTVEAATIRAMIQTAVGLAFLRSNKFVLGVSVHAGSGIVIARLPDGTWSAPSAIGIAGLGVGLQLGVEVAHSILILQTKEALEHFQLGGSFTVGANVGAAVMGHGREAVGAASLSGVLCGSHDQLYMIKDDEYHTETSPPNNAPSSVGIAPLVAYAKSQGLYVGLSLEGSRIHGRNEVNARTYQFDTRKAITAHDLLTGKVAPPWEASKLYEALHQVEFAQELQSLPKLPTDLWGRRVWNASSSPLLDWNSISVADRNAVEVFERKFRDFLYGGVEVWRVRGRKRERRTLWLYAPDGPGSLQLGFVSKLATNTVIEATRTGSNSEYDDRRSVASEDVTLDSALVENQSVWNHHQGGRANVELSSKNSVGLTDVLSMTQEMPSDLILEKPEESRRVITLDTTYNRFLFVAKSDQEACVLMSGIRILLDSETERCCVRGGIGKDGDASKGNTPTNSNSNIANSKRGIRTKKRGRTTSGYSSSDMEDNDDMSAMSINSTPEGWKPWGRLPGRNFLRGQAAANDQGCPQYILGQLLVREIAKNVHLPLPLPLCRVLLLDSSSPVISQWEKVRGDQDFEKTPWMFPPATPRERDQYQSEHQLIASGSMCGAHRTISYQRHRQGPSTVRLSETQIVDSDDFEKLTFNIHERVPRRGFSIKVKVLLRSYHGECEATLLAEIRPIGKDMSNPEIVHKALLLVLDELRERYGSEGKGLLAGFLDAVNTLKEEDLPAHLNRPSSKKFHAFGSGEEKKDQDSSSVSSNNNSNNNDGKSIKLEDMLKANATLEDPDMPEPKFLQDRSPSPMNAEKYRESYRKPILAPMPSDTFDAPASEPVMIEVKPLPKIRLSLMPSPREEDEFNLDEEGDMMAKDLKTGGGGGGGNSSMAKRARKSWGKKLVSRSDKS